MRVFSIYALATQTSAHSPLGALAAVGRTPAFRLVFTLAGFWGAIAAHADT